MFIVTVLHGSVVVYGNYGAVNTLYSGDIVYSVVGYFILSHPVVLLTLLC